jgi:hypothetical protein
MTRVQEKLAVLAAANQFSGNRFSGRFAAENEQTG